MCVHVFLATPAEVLHHYYCFLADSLNNKIFYQVMSSLKMLKEASKINLPMVASEYQRNILLLDDLLASDATNISKFCRNLQDTESQQEIGQMLVNGMCIYIYTHIYICM